MKTVSYKGYQASVEYEEGTLFVKVLHISDLLVAECDKASEAEGAARALIDDYLETCKELGRNPEPPFKGSFNVRMTPEQHRKVAMAAAEDGISLNAWVCQAVTEKLDCGRLVDRFDGVIARKDSEMRAIRTLRTLQADTEFVVAHSGRNHPETVHAERFNLSGLVAVGEKRLQPWGKANA
ncbi:type II toxin-antitoxin system HicB family antitoxin [Sinorhizobium sp. NFACC03]|uniref:type II toxin-antitoxin system HicB family antitoxin n=1 Tax=Sinorhizobium sp. NFACC03 TaxID=1566295 RepID=UPI0008899A83|nr:type II toxin-antitoxin system HicB family antitoxin [Sinorhizobium sp. NFACC03]SDA39612.1 Predicted nuclease of the RNAse H fold, HicB family [Sinorhizobium sp. NFACC03]